MLPHLHTEFAFVDIILHAEVADLTPATAEKWRKIGAQWLQGEKWSLKIQHAVEVQKKNKVMVETIMDEMKEVMTKIENTTKKLESSENYDN
jgi:hypothetical protein